MIIIPLTGIQATIGLNFLLEGVGQIAWGSDVKKLDEAHRYGNTEKNDTLINETLKNEL